MSVGSFIQTMLVFLVLLALFVACISVLVRTAAYLTRGAQDRFVYYPNIPEGSTRICESPLDYGIDHAEMVHIRTADGLILRGYLMWPPQTLQQQQPTANTATTTAAITRGKTVEDGVLVMTGAALDAPGLMGEVNKRTLHTASSTTAVCTNTSLTGTTLVPVVMTNGNKDELTSKGANTSGNNSSNNNSSSVSGTTNANAANTLNSRDADLDKPSTSTSAITSTVASPPRFTLLYFHGNAGNVGHRIEVARFLSTELQCAVLMMDYRGYGLSTCAEPSQEGLECDAQACLDYLYTDRRILRDRIFVMGTSLGGAVAIHLAAKAQNAPRIRGLIIENTFTSLGDMASEIAATIIHQHTRHCRGLLLKFFNYYLKPVGLMLRWNNLKTVQQIAMPILFLSGIQDEIVPAEQMRRLYKAANHTNRPRTFYTFQNGQHNNLQSEPRYADVIRTFIDKTLQ